MTYMPPAGSPVLQAERCLLEAEARVEKQRQLIAKLERSASHELAAAYRVLAALEEALFLARAYRNKLRDGRQDCSD